MVRLLLQLCDAILGICTMMESSDSHRVVEIALGTLTFTEKSSDFWCDWGITKRKLVANKLITKTSGKSGLTDYDSYMIGYTPLYTVGIWCGNDDGSLLTDTMSKEFPKKLFLQIINHLMKENKNIWYEKPNGIYSLFTDPTGFNTGYEKNVFFKN